MVNSRNSKRAKPGKEVKTKGLTDTPRTIEFYHFVQEAQGKPVPDIDVIVEALEKIPENERWCNSSNKERFDCRYEGKGQALHKIKISITRSRARDKRLDTQTAKSSNLPLLDHEETCAESHLLIFPDNFVSFEFNPGGPRLSQLTEFFEEKWPDFGRLSFKAAVTKDFEKNLEKVKKFNQVSITISNSNSDLYMAMDPDYARSVEAERKRTGAAKIKTIYYAERGKNSIADFAQGWARKVFSAHADDEKIFKTLQMQFKGPDDDDAVKRSIINLTCSRITSKKEFPYSNPVTQKSIDSEQAYVLLREAYDANIERLKKSVAVS